MPSDLASPPVIVTDLIRVSAPSAAEAVSIVPASVAAFPRTVSPPGELTLNPEHVDPYRPYAASYPVAAGESA